MPATRALETPSRRGRRDRPRGQRFGGVAFGGHRAALGIGVGCRSRPARSSSSVRPSLPQPERPDQGAVDDQIGIAPDRRGEMRVVGQGQPEMAELLLRSSRPGPRSAGWCSLIISSLSVPGRRQLAVEMGGLSAPAPLGQRQARPSLRISRSAFQLLRGGLLMDTVEQGGALRLQASRRRRHWRRS